MNQSPFDVTEHIQLDQFLVDCHKAEDTITVPSNWLQQQLIEVNKLKRTVHQQTLQSNANERYLVVLQDRIDSLLLAASFKATPRRIHQYLDVQT